MNEIKWSKSICKIYLYHYILLYSISSTPAILLTGLVGNISYLYLHSVRARRHFLEYFFCFISLYFFSEVSIYRILTLFLLFSFYFLFFMVFNSLTFVIIFIFRPLSFLSFQNFFIFINSLLPSCQLMKLMKYHYFTYV